MEEKTLSIKKILEIIELAEKNGNTEMDISQAAGWNGACTTIKLLVLGEAKEN